MSDDNRKPALLHYAEYKARERNLEFQIEKLKIELRRIQVQTRYWGYVHSQEHSRPTRRERMNDGMQTL